MHKPEWCLAGQGFRITDRSSLAVEGTTPPLDVALLSLDTEQPSGKRNEAYFAYWFVGPSTATDSRTEMLLKMTKERVIEGKAYRWAYIAVLIEKRTSSKQTLADLSTLIRRLHAKPDNRNTDNR